MSIYCIVIIVVLSIVVKMITVFHILLFTTKILMKTLYDTYFRAKYRPDVFDKLICDEVRYAGEPASFDEKNGVSFTPPVYRQRYLAVQDLFLKNRWRNKIKKIVDFGCAELKLFQYCKRIVGLQEILEVDIDSDLLENNVFRVEPLIADHLNRRAEPLHVMVLSGSIADPDPRLIGTDMVIGIEIIEHLYPDTLEALPYNIFEFVHPQVVVFTTPNADFNVLFKGLNTFRHDDHKFEWSKEQFRDWAINIIRRFPDYNVTFEGTGAPPIGNEDLGCCSQMAIFTLINENIPRTCDTTNDYTSFGVCTYESYTLKYLRTKRKTDKITNIVDQKLADVQMPNTKYFYKVISDVIYPFEADLRTLDEKIAMEIEYRLSVIGGEFGFFFNSIKNQAEVPLTEIFIYMQDICSFENLISVAQSHFEVEDCKTNNGSTHKCIIHKISSKSETDTDQDGFDCPNYSVNYDAASDWDDPWSNYSIAGNDASFREDTYFDEEGGAGDYCEANKNSVKETSDDVNQTIEIILSCTSKRCLRDDSESSFETMGFQENLCHDIINIVSAEKKHVVDQNACGILISSENSTVKLSSDITKQELGLNNEIRCENVPLRCNKVVKPFIMSAKNHDSLSQLHEDSKIAQQSSENVMTIEETQKNGANAKVTQKLSTLPENLVDHNQTVTNVSSTSKDNSNCLVVDKMLTKTTEHDVMDAEKYIVKSLGSDAPSLKSESSIDRSNSEEEQKDLLFDSGYQKSVLEMSPQSPNDILESDEFEDKSEMGRLDLKEMAAGKYEPSVSDVPDKIGKKKFELSKPKVVEYKGARKKELLIDKIDKAVTKPSKIILKQIETIIPIPESKNNSHLEAAEVKLSPVGDNPQIIPINIMDDPVPVLENPDANVFRPVIVENGDLINNNRDGEGNNYENLPEPVNILENDNEVLPQLPHPEDNLDVHNENHIILEENHENVFLVHENADFGDEVNDHGPDFVNVNALTYSSAEDVPDGAGPSTSSLEVNVSNNDLANAGAQAVSPIRVNIVNMLPPNNDQPEQMVGLLVNGNDNGINLLAEPFPDWLMRLLHVNVDVPEHLDYMSQGDNLTVNPNDDDFDESSSSQESNDDNEADDEQDDAPDAGDIESDEGLAIDASSNALLLVNNLSQQSLAGVGNIENEEVFFDSVDNLTMHIPSVENIPDDTHVNVRATSDVEEHESLAFYLAAVELPEVAVAATSGPTTEQNPTVESNVDADLNPKMSSW